MITILTGPPGHGKSYTLVRIIDDAVHKGKPVVTNVPLREDWSYVMAKRHTFLGFWRKGAVHSKAEKYRSLVFIAEDVNELIRVRIRGTDEGRALMVIDEGQRMLNVRNYREKKQVMLVDHASGHRHFGLDMLIATQHMDNLDGQIKRLHEYHSEVRNMKKFPLFGLIFRVNLFVRRTYWNDRRKSRASSPNVYLLDRKLARLYSTHALNELDWPDDAIVLPRLTSPGE